jgi:hypothetical protein
LNNPINFTDPMGTRTATPEDLAEIERLKQAVKNLTEEYRTTGTAGYTEFVRKAKVNTDAAGANPSVGFEYIRTPRAVSS